jgi:tetratricopeptide (TPR) repeat protein
MGTSATRISRWGTLARQSSTTRRTWRLQRRWAIGWGRGLFQGHRIPDEAPGNCKGSGRPGGGKAYANLGNEYRSQGDFSKAIDYHAQVAQDLAIAKVVGERAGEGGTYGNLGNVYQSQGDFSKAIEHLAKRLAIAKEVGNRTGEGREHRNLGTCHMNLSGALRAQVHVGAQCAQVHVGARSYGALRCAVSRSLPAAPRRGRAPRPRAADQPRKPWRTVQAGMLEPALPA